MNCFKKLALAGTIACTSLIMFAQDASGNSYDFTAVNTELEKVSAAVKSWVTAALPYILGVGGVMLIIFLGRLGFKMLKSMISAGK